jgi:hypothetical protein
MLGENIVKIILQNDLKAVLDVDPEYGNVLGEFLKSCSIFHRSEQNKYGDPVLVIPSQKIVLDEWVMNKFFHDVLFHFDYRMGYASLGGEGCDFSINLYSS